MLKICKKFFKTKFTPLLGYPILGLQFRRCSVVAPHRLPTAAVGGISAAEKLAFHYSVPPEAVAMARAAF